MPNLLRGEREHVGDQREPPQCLACPHSYVGALCLCAIESIDLLRRRIADAIARIEAKTLVTEISVGVVEIVIRSGMRGVMSSGPVLAASSRTQVPTNRKTCGPASVRPGPWQRWSAS